MILEFALALSAHSVGESNVLVHQLDRMSDLALSCCVLRGLLPSFLGL